MPMSLIALNYHKNNPQLKIQLISPNTKAKVTVPLSIWPWKTVSQPSHILLIFVHHICAFAQTSKLCGIISLTFFCPESCSTKSCFTFFRVLDYYIVTSVILCFKTFKMIIKGMTPNGGNFSFTCFKFILLCSTFRFFFHVDLYSNSPSYLTTNLIKVLFSINLSTMQNIGQTTTHQI